MTNKLKHWTTHDTKKFCDLVYQNKSYAEIAAIFNITVNNMRARAFLICEQLGVKDRTEMMALEIVRLNKLLKEKK